MNAWSDGYVSDIDYTYEYINELNPVNVEATLINQGIICPEIDNACELGFGQGLSINMHSAASTVSWYGTDFNPAQASFAQELGDRSGAKLHIFDDAFETFLHRQCLPSFDFIGLHGVWSWVSEHNRQVLVNFLKTKLRPGGVVYISYNSLPGWSSFVPMRHILTQHASIMGADGEGSQKRIDKALGFAEEVLNLNPAYTATYPDVGNKLNDLRGRSRNYLAHEYFNRDWRPMHFADLAKYMGEAKLSFACSATIADDMDQILLTEEQKEFVTGISDPILRQTVRDFILNKPFRRDYWVKGLRRMDSAQQLEQLRSLRVTLQKPANEIQKQFNHAGKTVSLSAAVYDPVIDAIDEHDVLSVGEIELQLKNVGISISQIREVVVMLSQKGDLKFVNRKPVRPEIEKQTSALNEALLAQALHTDSSPWLVSPLTGGGVWIERLEQLFLLAIRQGHSSPKDLANSAWSFLSRKGEKMVVDGRPLETETENVKRLLCLAQTFVQSRYSTLERLKSF